MKKQFFLKFFVILYKYSVVSLWNVYLYAICFCVTLYFQQKILNSKVVKVDIPAFMCMDYRFNLSVFPLRWWWWCIPLYNSWNTDKNLDWWEQEYYILSLTVFILMWKVIVSRNYYMWFGLMNVISVKRLIILPRLWYNIYHQICITTSNTRSEMKIDITSCKN